MEYHKTGTKVAVLRDIFVGISRTPRFWEGDEAEVISVDVDDDRLPYCIADPNNSAWVSHEDIKPIDSSEHVSVTEGEETTVTMEIRIDAVEYLVGMVHKRLNGVMVKQRDNESYKQACERSAIEELMKIMKGD